MADPAYDSGDPPPRHIAFLEEDRQDEGYLWTRCSSCGRHGIHFEGRSRRLCGCEAGGGKEGRDEVRCQELIIAYGRALSENFDPPWNARKQLKPTGSLGR